MAQALACLARPAAGRAPARMASSPPRTASCSAHTSPDQHTKSKPRAAWSMPLAASGTRRPSALPCRCAAAPIRSTASANLRMRELPRNAERRRQVEMPDPQAVDALDGGDGVDMLDPGGGLDEGEQAGPLVCGGEPLVHRAGAAEIVVGDAERDAAGAERRVFEVRDELACLGVGVDHRHHDGLGADVGRAGDVVVALRGHAHDRRQLRRLAVAHRALHRFEGEARMLHVDEGEVAARSFEDVADPRRRELDEEMTELELARPAQPLQGVRHPRRPPGRSGGGRHSP